MNFTSITGHDFEELRTLLRTILNSAKEHPVFDEEIFDNRDYNAMITAEDSDTTFAVGIAINAEDALDILNKYFKSK